MITLIKFFETNLKMHIGMARYLLHTYIYQKISIQRE